MPIRPVVALWCAAVLALAASADAQPRWEVEFHGGGALVRGGTDGTTALPPNAEPFTTLTSRSSRRVSSWFVGDGARLMNEINTAFGLGTTARIAPLDPALAASPVDRAGGGGFGIRVGYVLTPRFTVGFNLDSIPAGLELTEALRSRVETTRASFIPAWNGLISTGGGVVFTGANVTSAADIQDESGRQLFTTAHVEINLLTGGRVIPYASVGAGIASIRGDLPSITLVGNYRFQSLNILGINTFPVNETDTLTLRVASDDSFVAVLGGGVKFLAAGRWGARADVRAHIGDNKLELLLDADPSVVNSSPPGVIASALTPSLQFANQASGSRSTLSGPAIDDFKTFTGTGRQVHVLFTAGVFLRF